MSDKEPLLNISNNLSLIDNDDNENNKQHSTNRFSNWRRYFSNKEVDDKHGQLDYDTEYDDKDVVVGTFQLFRFADHIDFLLMFIAGCLMVVHIICILANLLLFGRVTGIFAIESFSDNCNPKQQNSIVINTTNNMCPLGIELNSVNYIRLQRLCANNNIIMPSTLAIPKPLFREKVMRIVYLLIIIGGVEFLCATVENYIWTISVKRQTSRMNISLFRSLIQRNISYLDMNSTSQLNAKLFENIRKIEAGIGFEFLILTSTVLAISGSLITSFFVNWQLTLILLCIIPVVIGSSLIFSKIIANEAMNELKTYSKAGQIVQEVFSSLRTVLSLNGIKFERKRYEKELQSTRRNSIRQGAVLGIFTGWIAFTTYIVYAIGFIFGSLLMSYENNNNELNIGDILIVVLMFAECMNLFSFVGAYFQSFSEARGAAAPVFRLIDEGQIKSMNEPDIWEENTSDKDSIDDINGDIEFDNVTFIYPSRKERSVLRNINIMARSGQTTALVGSSGCGKSTCISLLLRYYEPLSGQITINNRSIKDYNLKQLRQNIGVVSQEPILFGISIYENIRFGKINATQTEIEEAARQANAHNFIMKLPNKYKTLVGERGIQLSGGEKQRIALARALVKQPTVLLLDEATSALDNVSEKIVQEALDRACKDRTTIVIAHRLTTIQNAHQIYVLDDGRVIEQGTHETLMEKEDGKYQTMVKSQQMERINDDKMSIEVMKEEDEKQIFERSRLLSDTQTVNIDKESSSSLNRQSTFLRLLSMNSPEWSIILIGCIACLCSGAFESMFAFLLAKIINAFKHCTQSERYRQVLIFSFLFLLLGLLILILRFIQYTTFAISGSKLTQRIRSKAFAYLLRQEVAYFDRSENSSGSICARLSTDASAIQEMSGTRLGIICEAVALFFFGFLFGCFFSWQLTIIVFIPLGILGIIAYLDIRLTIWIKQQTSLILSKASSHAGEIIHNMRTVKQLSIEKEVLRQYSEFIHHIFVTTWKYAIMNAVEYGAAWLIEIYILVFLYWRALILFEKNEIALSNIVM